MTAFARRIDALRSCPVPFEQAREVVLKRPGVLFREELPEAASDTFTLNLGVDIAAGASIHQDVLVQLGAPVQVASSIVVPVLWRGPGRDHLVPAFKGQLALSPSGQYTTMALVGSYTVPLGVVGRFGDGVLGWRLARRTFETLADRLMARLVETARSSAQLPAPAPSPNRVDTHENDVG